MPAIFAPTTIKKLKAKEDLNTDLKNVVKKITSG
jgi:hypothetical protein